MDALAEFQNVASVLAGSSSQYSRYRADRYTAYSSRFVPSSSPADEDGGGGRHMVWDDDEEEEEEEEDEDEKRRRIAMEEMRWNRTEEDMQSKLDATWNNFFNVGSSGSSHPVAEKEAAPAPVSDGASPDATSPSPPSSPPPPSPNNPASSLRWSHYYMPPHPPPSLFQSPLPFPTAAANNIHNPYRHILQSHHTGLHQLTEPLTKKWREEVLSDNIRRWMERCDCIRGIQLAVDADGEEGLWGGLAESTVMELRDECRSAAVMGVLVDNYRGGGGGGDGDDDGESCGKGGRKRAYWRGEEEVASSVRRNLNRGLTLAGLASADAGGGCDALVPISLGSCFGKEVAGKRYYSTFEASAVGALALEAATLPFRLRRGGGGGGRGERRSKIGVQSGYFQGGGGSGGNDNDAFGSTDRLSFQEFLSSLRPSNRHILLELSTSMVCGVDGETSSTTTGSPTASSLHEALLQGTSIERRKLEEERNRSYSSFSSRLQRSRGRDIEPGLWMEDTGPCGGSLIPLTPSPSSSNGDSRSRSLHRHYALSTSFRPASSAATPVVRSSRQSLLSSSPTSSDGTVSSYTTMLMEGMGIRYRPETCVGTVVNQSLTDLIGSRPYGAGSYWKTVLRGHHGRGVSTTPSAVPILTVLGNTTRVHSHLHSRARGMKDSLSSKYSGYRRKDCTAGIIPESEDCTEAMEVCDSLRDLYEPLMGGADEETEVYFEDNED